MKADVNMQAEQYIRQGKKRRNRGRIVAALSVLVALTTTYVLMLPGITMERNAQCGVEAHQHSEACYVSNLICQEQEREASATEIVQMACDFKPHEHTDECYRDSDLACGKTSEYFHEHDAMCLDAQGNLICTLTENIKHEHTGSCYEDVAVLNCQLAEDAGHLHSEACYTLQPAQEPTCGLAENLGHTHTDTCITTSPTCGMEEQVGHIHGESCQQSSTVLTCTTVEVAAHTHGDGCCQTVSELTCGQNEGEGAHTHSDNCYINETNLTCGQNEGEGAHSHGEGCYTAEQKQICDKAEGEGAHAHGEGCFTTEHALTCTVAEHAHGDACRDAEGNIICGVQEHAHGDACYTAVQNMVCTMEESAGHAHGTDCFTTENKLSCSLTETAGHAHGDVCYTTTTKLNCSTAETSGHAHADACYTTKQEIVCTQSETAGHAHGEGCYTTSISIVCGQNEGDGAHTHSEACYTTAQSCGLAEGEGAHQHGEACYVLVSTLACGLDGGAGAHVHSETCYITQRQETCNLPELHEHESACYETDVNGKRWAICELAELQEHQHSSGCLQTETAIDEGHAHGEACYEAVLVCEIAEHVHTDECYPDVTAEPTNQPTVAPVEEETAEPTTTPMETATVLPTEEATVEPTVAPEETVTVAPVEEETAEPTTTPTETATVLPTEEATVEPTVAPEETVTVAPVEEETAEPTTTPTETATVLPTEEATVEPTVAPEETVTVAPVEEETAEPTTTPTETATVLSTEEATVEPTVAPEETVTVAPVEEETAEPTTTPTETATVLSTEEATVEPTVAPEETVTVAPVEEETAEPATIQTKEPIAENATESDLQPTPTSTPTFTLAPAATVPDPDFDTTVTTNTDLNEDVPSDEQDVYFCGIEEHIHDDICWNDAYEVICGAAKEHLHNKSCEIDPTKTFCGQEQHQHNELCFDENWNLICGVDEHQHHNDCLYRCGIEEHVHLTLEEAAQQVSVFAVRTFSHDHASACYDENGALICGQEEHTHTEECVMPLSTDAGIESSAEITLTVNEKTVNIVQGGSGEVDKLEMHFSAGYEISTENAQKYTQENPLDLPMTGFDMSQLVGDEWKPDSGDNGMYYRFKQNGDGTYVIQIYFDNGKIASSQSPIEGTIWFDATLDSTAEKGDGSYQVKVNNEEIIITPKDIYGSETDETVFSDIAVTKSDGVVNMQNGTIDYAITITSTKGTPGVIEVTDTLVAPGIVITNTADNPPVIVSAFQRENSAWSKTDVEKQITKYAYDPESKTISMTLPQLEIKENETSVWYEITYRYNFDPSTIPANGSVEQNNTINVTSEEETDKTYPDKVTDSDEGFAKVEKSSISKTGSFNESTGLITWTIKLNSDKQNIEGAMITDLGFMEALGLTENSFGSETKDLGNGITQVMTSTELTAKFGESFKVESGDSSLISLVEKDEKYYLYFNPDSAGTNTNSYTFTYTTKPETNSWVSTTTKNEVTYVHGDSSVSDEAIVSVSSGTLTKSFNEAISINNTTYYELDWIAVITLPPDGIPAGTHITDEVQEYPAMWYTDDQVKALYNAIQGQDWYKQSGASFWVKPVGVYEYEKFDPNSTNTSEIYYGWQIQHTNAIRPWTDNDIQQNEITLNYSTTADSSVSNGDRTYKNKIWIDNKSDEGNWRYTEPVVKKDGNNSTKTSSKTLDVNSNVLTWNVDVNMNDDYNKIVVSDTLPSVKVDLNGDNTAETMVPVILTQIKTSSGTVITVDENGEIDVKPGYADGGSGNTGVAVDISATISGPTVTVTLNNTDSDKAPSYMKKDQKLTLQFNCKLPDSVFDVLKAGETLQLGSFTNNVSVSVEKDSETSQYGSASQTQVVSVKKEQEQVDLSQSFGKNGVWYNEDNQTSTGGAYRQHVMDYVVDINKNGLNLDETGDTLTIIDTLSHRSGGLWYSWPNDDNRHNGAYCYADIPVSVSMQIDSVKLYKAQTDANGNILKDANGNLIAGEALPSYRWSMGYTTQDGNKYILTLSVPDGMPLVLKYTYGIEIDRDFKKVIGENSCGCAVPSNIPLSGEAAFNNTLQYASATVDNFSTSGNVVWQAATSGATMNTDMTIYKVDAINRSILLDGAKFELFVWDSTKTDFVTTNKKYVTVDGKFALVDGSADNGEYDYQTNTAYRIKEVEAPFGYEISDYTFDFYFAATDGSTAMIGPTGFPTGFENLSDGGSNVYVPNSKKATSVAVEKIWSTEEGVPSSVDVYLYRYALTDEQWKAVNEYVENGTTSLTEYTANATITYNTLSTASSIAAKEIRVKEGDTLVVTLKLKEGGYNLWLNGAFGNEDVFSQLVRTEVDGDAYYILKIYGIEENISLNGRSAWDGPFGECEIILSTEKAVSEDTEKSDVYTTDRLTKALGSDALVAARDSYSREMTLYASQGWKGSWDNLDLLGKDAGDNTIHYVYAVEEAAMAGWSSSVEGGGSDDGYKYTITNTADGSTMSYTSLSVRKVWQDINGTPIEENLNQDPVTVQLYWRDTKVENSAWTAFVYENNSTIQLDAGKGWQFNFTGLQDQKVKTQDGATTVLNDYEYMVVETSTGNFITTYSNSEENDVTVTTITNRKVAEVTEIHVQKEWAEGTPTKAVDIYLRRYKVPVGVDGNPTETIGETHNDIAFNNQNKYVTLSAGASTGSFTQLETETVDGEQTYRYYYYVEEDAEDAAGYTVTYTNNGGILGNDATTPIIVTNTAPTEEKTEITVEKKWVKADGVTALTENLPDEITFALMQISNGDTANAVQHGENHTLNAGNGWKITIPDLPKSGDNGTVYTYMVKENALLDYGFVVSYDNNSGIEPNGGTITMTNRATELELGKQWRTSDGGSQWTQQNNTTVYLQLYLDQEPLTHDLLVKYIDESAVTSDGYIKIVGSNKVTLTALPLGNYTVKEVGYQLNGGSYTAIDDGNRTSLGWIIDDNNTQTLAADSLSGSITVSNTAKKQLTIRKEWKDKAGGAWTNHGYTVYMQVKNNAGNVIDPTNYVPEGTTVYTDASSNEKWLPFAANGSVTLTGLDADTYTVTEIAYMKTGDAAPTRISNENVNQLAWHAVVSSTAELVNSSAAEVTVTNTATQLNITKTWLNTDGAGWTGHGYTVYLQLWQKNAGGSTTQVDPALYGADATSVTAGDATYDNCIAFSADGAVTLKGLPAGTYTVTEVAFSKDGGTTCTPITAENDDQVPWDVTIAEATLTTAEAATVAVTNTQRDKLTITKEWDDGNNDERPSSIQVELYRVATTEGDENETTPSPVPTESPAPTATSTATDSPTASPTPTATGGSETVTVSVRLYYYNNGYPQQYSSYSEEVPKGSTVIWNIEYKDQNNGIYPSEENSFSIKMRPTNSTDETQETTIAFKSPSARVYSFLLGTVDADVTVTWITDLHYSAWPGWTHDLVYTQMRSMARTSTLPASATLVDTFTLPDNGSWTKEIYGLDATGTDGSGNAVTYKYYVQETNVATGYTVTYAYGDGTSDGMAADGSVTITNTKNDLQIETTEIVVTKQWVDSDGEPITAPKDASVQLQLMCKASDGSDDEQIQTIHLPDNGSWSKTIGQLPLNNGAGVTYTYYVKEVGISGVNGFTVDYGVEGQQQTNAVSEGELVVTNRADPTSITIKKTWLDAAGNALTNEPNTIQVELYRRAVGSTDEGELVGTHWLTKPDWSLAIENLPKQTTDEYGNIVTYEYIVKEVSVDGFETTNPNAWVQSGELAITNKVKQFNIDIEKKWGQGSDKKDVAISVNRYILDSNGNKIVDEAFEKAEGNWKMFLANSNEPQTVLNLPGYGSIMEGEKVVISGEFHYFVEEQDITENYNVTYSTDGGNTTYTNEMDASLTEAGTLTVTNTGKTKLTVKKQWRLSDGQPAENVNIELWQVARNRTETSGEDSSTSTEGTVKVTFTIQNEVTWTDNGQVFTGYNTLATTSREFPAGSTVIWQPIWTWTTPIDWGPLSSNEGPQEIKCGDRSVQFSDPVKQGNCWYYSFDLGQINQDTNVVWTTDNWYGETVARNWYHRFTVNNESVTQKWDITLNEDNSWTWEFEDLPIQDETGEITYAYVATETTGGYTVTYDNNGISDGTITVINSEAETLKTSLTVKKLWKQANGETDLTSYDAQKVKFTLYRNTEGTEPYAVETVELTRPDDGSAEWTYTFYNLDVLDWNNNLYIYHVEEIEATNSAEQVMDSFDVTYSSDGKTWTTSEKATAIPGTTSGAGNTLYIRNSLKTTYVLPETGGEGTQWYTGVGAVLIGIALTLLYKGNKRKRRAEK